VATLFKNASAQSHGARYAKRMSSHLAAALVAFCLLQIAIVARFGGSLILHLALIVAVGGFAMAARKVERRWEILEASGLSRAGLDLRFRRDVAQVWLTSLLSSLLWIPVAIIFRFLFG